MERQVLLVIDMQNDFVDPRGALSFPQAREIVPFIRDKVKMYLEEGKEIIFTLDTHAPEDAEFKKFPPHCLEGSWGQELIPELREVVGEAGEPRVRFLKKNRYSAFYNTPLDQWLGTAPGSPEGPPALVEVVGVCTNICVFFTVEELANRDVPVKVYSQGVASFDPEAHRFALDQMAKVLGAEIV